MDMKTVKGAIVILGLLSMYQANADLAKVGAFVVDGRTGEPLKNVLVRGGFDNHWGWLAVKGAPLPNESFARTDANGFCRLRGRTNIGEAGVSVREAPPGFYRPCYGEGWSFKRKNLLGIWQPDNLVATIRLQRVEHPIPLFVKACKLDVKREIAGVNGGRFALDLMAGDWLPPFGKGKVADIEFARLPHEDLGEGVNDSDVRGTSFRDSMSVRFSGEGNGLVESNPPPNLRLRIRTAPEDGYRPDYLCWTGRNGKLEYVGNYDENRCFCFRIRTRRDDRGRIVEAYYGKIYGDILMYTGYNFIVCGVKFLYYHNPTPLDRNLEWDRKTNLGPDRVNYDLLP